MDQVTTAVEDPTSPLVIEHEEGRMLEQTPAQDEGPSELEKHKRDRGYTKAPETPKTPEPPPLPEAAAETPQEPAKEKKKDERWTDPDTNDTYDMRHKVARRVKTLLEDRGKARAEVESLRKERDELLRAVLQGRSPVEQPPPKPQQTQADTDPEPDPADTTTYPEGQFDPKFIKDIGRWAARQETKTKFDEARTEATTAAQQAAEARALSEWQQTLPETRKRYSDFDDVLARIPTTPENAPIVRMMMGSPVGNDVVYVLGTQEQAMEAYRRAPNHESRLRLLHHIEAQIISSQRSAKQPTPPKTTKAPPPTSPIHTGAGPQGPIDWTRSDDPDQLQRWKAQRASRR